MKNCTMLILTHLLQLFEAKQENISGDFRGDGFQNGGTLVVAPGEFLNPFKLIFNLYWSGESLPAKFPPLPNKGKKSEYYIHVHVKLLNFLLRNNFNYHGFSSGGKVLVSYKQENPSDNMDIQEILRVLGIKEEF